MNIKLIRHAYINTIEMPIKSDAGYKEGLLRFHLRGYSCGKDPGIDIDKSIDSLMLIRPDHIPDDFKVGRKVKVTIELEED